MGSHRENASGAPSPRGAAQVAASFAAQAQAEGVELLVTPDVESRDHLRALTQLEVVDLLWLVARALGVETQEG